MSTDDKTQDGNKLDVTRRDFVVKGAVGLGAAAAAANMNLIARAAYAQEGGRTYGLGIIGSGGRGGGAIGNHMAAAAELGIDVELRAMADLAPGRLEGQLQAQQNNLGDKVKVDEDSRFTGFDAYKGVCEHDGVDIIIQTTPPGLRYMTLREAVKNGKHSFVEKPVCVDGDTYRSVLASGDVADDKSLSIVTGTQYRRETTYADAIAQLQDGIIGDITASYAYYCAGTLWHHGRGNPPWSEMEYQMRNWLYFTWLSGDHIAEQSVHNIDAINWAMGGPPTECYASGGRIARTGEEYGNIYDHFSVHYKYANGSTCAFMSRQYPGAKNRVENRFIGTEGTLDLQPNPGRTRWIARTHDGETIARFGSDNNQPYVEEHKALLEAVVSGNPIQEIKECADSSLTAVMGRESAYTGQIKTFAEMAESPQKLRPAEPFEAGPVEQGHYKEIPIPGTYQG